MRNRAAGEDPYRPVARVLALFEWGLEQGMRRVRRDTVRVLRRHGASRVMDVACGTGTVSRALADAGLQPVGLDASPTMLARAERRAQRHPRFRVVLGDAADLPFGQEFDAAVISLALHEMPPDVRAAAWSEMMRVVRPGGLLVAVDHTLPESTGLRARVTAAFMDRMEGLAGRMHPPHYAHYREFMEAGGLLGWLGARGAVIAEERRYYSGNLALVAVRR